MCAYIFTKQLVKATTIGIVSTFEMCRHKSDFNARRLKTTSPLTNNEICNLTLTVLKFNKLIFLTGEFLNQMIKKNMVS